MLVKLIVEESGTISENEPSRHKLQRARANPRRRRVTPIKIISVGVNEIAEGRDWEREGMRKDCGKEATSASPRAHARWNRRGWWGLNSACALRFIPPFPPSFRNSPLLISHPTPLSSPLVFSVFFPPISLSPSVISRFSSRFSVARSRFPFSSLDFPSLSRRNTRILSLPHRASLFLCLRFSFSRLSVSFIPFRYAAHCSRVSRIAEVKPSDDFLAGTWFRALLFPSLSLFLLSAFTAEADCYRWPVGGHTRSVGRNETTEGEGDFRSDRCHCQWWKSGTNEGVTGVASN